MALGIILIAAIFGPMIFRDQITASKLKLSQEVVSLLDGIQVAEISDNEQPLPYEYQPGTGDVAAADEMLLFEDGMIEPGRRVYDNDPRKQVHVLSGNQASQSLVFKGNDVYRFVNNRLGDHIGTISSPALRSVSHVTVVTDNALLLAGYLASVPHADVRLYQINLPDWRQEEIAVDPYYTFSRPPKIFKPDGFDGVVVVYYTGEYSFAYGGDSSRPKYSVIRVYNKAFSEGRDVVKLGFKAGTVVNMSWQNGALILRADPSLPAMMNKPRMPARVWRVILPN